ncbi:MAG: UvrD-helicase domain-containing protein [Flavobacterium sp.]|jgi:ATP-dependent exoDNAse (exonuclease V) beta subunit|nr:UvrD-helicase domain-containing protein [Flavobacterium sp.]
MQRPSFSIYDASAGSGKTYALVKEYLKIILVAKKNDAYRNILAITFTNKAVHEMKSRIVGNLLEFAKDNPNEKATDLMEVLSGDIQLSVSEIQSKSKQIIKHIIHNYAAFDISTIDKFTHKVIRAFAHDLNLPMTFEVTLDTENLLTEAVDAIIAQAGEDDVLTKLLIDFTMQKTDEDKSWDISREILETGRLLLNENNREEITHFQDKSITEFIEIKNKVAEACKVIDKENGELAKSLLALIDTKGIDIKSFSAGHFPNHLNTIAVEKFNPNNKTYHEFEDIKIIKAAKDKIEIEAIIPELLIGLEAIYKKFEKREFYNAFLKNITPLSLLNTVSNELAKIQKEQNVLSIAEFNAIIYNEIQNQPAPFIYERLGERYRHFFIDEFQDTSEMQWQNLIPLIDNATSSEIEGEKGTLMIVGDPKQSIYRWRGGKAEQFIELSKGTNPFNNPDKQLFKLGTNYRSYSQVIDFNNKLFYYLSTEFTNLNYQDLYENHSRQEENSKKGGYVSISFIPKLENSSQDDDALDKIEQYLQATLKTIEKVKTEGFEYQEIVILTRKRAQGTAVANFLIENNIPIISSETLMIQNSSDVQMIINVLRYLNNSSDIEAKASFLLYISNQVQSGMDVHDFIAKGKEKSIEKEFEAWLSEFDISLSFQDIRKKSLYEAVEIIVSKFLSPTLSGNSYVQYFIDIVLERDVRNQAGIADFLNYWNKNKDKFSIPSPEGKNAIRIMTIHKSKGLEFPVVIMPFADEDYARKPKDKLWLDAEQETFGLPKVLIDNSSSVENFGEDAATVFYEKKQEELLDNINVLYVALTRAEEQLYVISQYLEPNKEDKYPYNSASFFIEYLIAIEVYNPSILEYEFGNRTKLSKVISVTDETNTIPIISQVLDPKNIKIAQREALMWGTHQQEAIEYGNIIHEILSFVKTASDIDLAVLKAIENGLIITTQKEVVLKSIQEIVNNKELESYFSADNEILNEQAIIQKEGKTIKPDRMVLTKNKEVYLLDYKTGTHNQKYQLQLENYQNAIEKMGLKVTKKALVYIGKEINVVNL